MLPRCSPIGIDADGRFLNAVQLGSARGGRRLLAAASIPRQGDMDDLAPDELSVLVSALGRQGFRGRRVVVPVPQDRLMTDVVEVPEGDPTVESVREQVARANRCDTTDLEVDWWALPDSSARATRRSMMTVACAHEPANHLIDVHEHAGLSVVALDARACALARACGSPDESTLVGVLQLGWTTAQIVVCCGSTVIFHREIDEFGLNRLFMSISVRLGLEADVADFLLRQVGLDGDDETTPDSRRVTDIQAQLKSHIERLVNEIRRSFSYVRQEYPDRPIAHLALAGEGSDLPGVADRFSGAVGVEARPATLASLLGGAADVPAAIATTGRLATALGLAMHGGTVA